MLPIAMVAPGPHKGGMENRHSLRLTAIRASDDPDRLAALVAPGYHGKIDEPRQIFEQTRSFLEAYPRPGPWGSYLAWDGDRPVGLCAYKSAPDEAGAVEIAYGTLPAFEGQGYAQSMILALVELAMASGASLVFANTLPEPNGSNGALQRTGFAFAGEAIDPEDGLVWRWEKLA